MNAKQLEARLAVAKTARERAELSAGIAFLRKQAAARREAVAASGLPPKGNWLERERDAALLNSGAH